jgi:hypothetical protein
MLYLIYIYLYLINLALFISTSAFYVWNYKDYTITFFLGQNKWFSNKNENNVTVESMDVISLTMIKDHGVGIIIIPMFILVLSLLSLVLKDQWKSNLLLVWSMVITGGGNIFFWLMKPSNNWFKIGAIYNNKEYRIKAEVFNKVIMEYSTLLAEKLNSRNYFLQFMKQWRLANLENKIAALKWMPMNNVEFYAMENMIKIIQIYANRHKHRLYNTFLDSHEITLLNIWMIMASMSVIGMLYVLISIPDLSLTPSLCLGFVAVIRFLIKEKINKLSAFDRQTRDDLIELENLLSNLLEKVPCMIFQDIALPSRSVLMDWIIALMAF